MHPGLLLSSAAIWISLVWQLCSLGLVVLQRSGDVDRLQGTKPSRLQRQVCWVTARASVARGHVAQSPVLLSQRYLVVLVLSKPGKTRINLRYQLQGPFHPPRSLTGTRCPIVGAQASIVPTRDTSVSFSLYSSSQAHPPTVTPCR